MLSLGAAILDGQHSPTTVQSMTALWRLVISPGATEIRIPNGPNTGVPVQIILRENLWQGTDFFVPIAVH
jgi:hypothetical protein